MLEPDAGGFLPDGRAVWQLSPEEKEALKRAAYKRAVEQAAAESAAAQAFDERVSASVRGKLAGGLPSAKDLGVDVKGQPPARERLLRGLGWIERLKGEAASAAARRAAHLQSLGAPQPTRDALAEIETAVGDAIRKQYASGSVGPAPDTQKSVREELLARLAEQDALAAEISGGLLAAEEIEIAALGRAVEELEQRVPRWQSDVLVEIGGAVGPKVKRLVEELRGELGVICALGQVVDERSDLRHVARGTKMALGVPFEMDVDMEVPGGARVGPIVAQWEKIRAAIAKDPRASVTAPGSRQILPEKIAAIETAAADLAPKAVGILKRVAQAITPAAPKPPEPEPAALPYEFNTYHDVIH